MVRILLVTGSPLVGMYYGVELYWLSCKNIYSGIQIFSSDFKNKLPKGHCSLYLCANLMLELQQ